MLAQQTTPSCTDACVLLVIALQHAGPFCGPAEVASASFTAYRAEMCDISPALHGIC